MLLFAGVFRWRRTGKAIDIPQKCAARLSYGWILLRYDSMCSILYRTFRWRYLLDIFLLNLQIDLIKSLRCVFKNQAIVLIHTVNSIEDLVKWSQNPFFIRFIFLHIFLKIPFSSCTVTEIQCWLGLKQLIQCDYEALLKCREILSHIIDSCYNIYLVAFHYKIQCYLILFIELKQQFHTISPFKNCNNIYSILT